ncbi:MAG TPA: hypothetical protein VGQ57_05530 [Polyangiaceae bacterium]|nr:hypothetical protein [Polyangiaceae bacterium]
MRPARLVLLLALASACQRKAAGIPECRALAYRMYGVVPGELVTQGVHDRVSNRIRECLLTPYDRELVRCLASGERERLCTRAFAERRLGEDDHYQPRLR